MDWQVCGNLYLPIADRYHAWNAEEAQKRIFAWAGWDKTPDPIQTRQAFFACDNDKPNDKSAYKLPFTDVIDGKLTVVPRALFAIANTLNRDHAIPGLTEEVLTKVRQRVEIYFQKMGIQLPRSESEVQPELTPQK